MPVGGRQPGAGRPPGSKNRSTLERELAAARGWKAAVERHGPSPLEIMMKKMDGDLSITDDQFQAAVAAAPYIHPRLASTDTTIKSDNVHRVVSSEPLTAEQWTAQHATPVVAAVAVAPPTADDVVH